MTWTPPGIAIQVGLKGRLVLRLKSGVVKTVDFHTPATNKAVLTKLKEEKQDGPDPTQLRP